MHDLALEHECPASTYIYSHRSCYSCFQSFNEYILVGQRVSSLAGFALFQVKDSSVECRIFCFPAVRSCQQSQGLRDLTLLPASNGHIGNAAALHGLRDARSSASRFGSAICVPSSSHSIAARPHIATKPTVPVSSARCRHSCSAKSKDAGNSSAEAFCQPSSGDMERQNLRAASQNVGDVAQSSSQAGLSGAQQREETHPSRKTSAEPGRAHFKPGEVVKQSSKRSVRRRSAKEVVIDVTGESVPDSSSRRVCNIHTLQSVLGCMHTSLRLVINSSQAWAIYL